MSHTQLDGGGKEREREDGTSEWLFGLVYGIGLCACIWVSLIENDPLA